MRLFQPTIYQPNIFEINYARLKELGITCLVFDLDNTLGSIQSKTSPKDTKELIKKLQEDFLVLICSNNFKRRVKPFMDELSIGGVCFSMKPFLFGLNKIKRKYQLTKKEMCLIGDQMVTDVLAGNRFRIMTILVDPMEKLDLKITTINRILERKIIQKYQKRNIFERGKYYEK